MPESDDRRDPAAADGEPRRGSSDTGPGRADPRPDDDEDGGPGFALPPLRLPPLRLPAGLRLPLPERPPRTAATPRTRLVAALGWDAVDAGLALAGAPPVLAWSRVVGGLGVAALATGVYGTLYAWEAVAVAAGVPELTALPTLTLLLLVRRRR